MGVLCVACSIVNVETHNWDWKHAFSHTRPGCTSTCLCEGVAAYWKRSVSNARAQQHYHPIQLAVGFELITGSVELIVGKSNISRCVFEIRFTTLPSIDMCGIELLKRAITAFKHPSK